MAAKKTTKKKQDTSREKRPFNEGISWRVDNLSKAQSQDLDERYPDEQTLLDFLTSCVDSGIDVKVAYSPYNDAYQATAVGAWNGYTNSGFGCSGFSRQSAADALAVIWYKVVVVADGDLSSILSVDEAEDLRG